MSHSHEITPPAVETYDLKRAGEQGFRPFFCLSIELAFVFVEHRRAQHGRRLIHRFAFGQASARFVQTHEMARDGSER